MTTLGDLRLQAQLLDKLERIARSTELLARREQRDAIITAAADSLIEVHEATGINLYHAPAWLALVLEVYPGWSSEQKGH